MTLKSIGLDEQLYQYLCQVSLREPKILQKLRQETSSHPRSNMQIAPEQGQFMALLIRLMGVKKALEIGVFTGYSSLAVALALPEDGKLIACDVSEEYTAIARRYWQEAKVEEKISLYIAPALETLEQLINRGEANSFDFVFIDADKNNYISYYEKSLTLLRPGGLIAVDNVLWYGRVADETNQDNLTQALRQFNDYVAQDERVFLSLLPIADGLTLAIKK